MRRERVLFALVLAGLLGPARPGLAAMSQLGRYDSVGSASATAVSADETKAYLADGSANLAIVGVANPAAPSLLGALDTAGTASGAKLSPDGTRLYLANGSDGLRIINVSIPAAPFALGAYATSGAALGVALSSDETKAYVAASGQGLVVVNVSNPAAPTLLGVYNSPGTARGVTLSPDGTRAYLADSASGVEIVDVSNPASPTLLGSYATGGTASASAVSADGKTLFVAAGSQGLIALSVANPAAPTLLGQRIPPTGSSQSVVLNAAGSLAFAAQGTAGIAALDVSDPTQIDLVEVFDPPTSGAASASDVVLGPGGAIAYASFAAAGLYLVDVSGVAAGSGATYDYLNRTQGTNIFAYRGTSLTQIPTSGVTPATVLTSAQYDGIEVFDHVFHSVSTSTNNLYVQTRYVIRIDEPAAALTSLTVTWQGAGANGTPGKVDGASLYAWNYATSSYTLLQASADTEAEIALSGTISTSPTDYLGGGASDTVTLLVVSNDKRSGSGPNTLSSDYLKLEVGALASGPIAEWRMEESAWTPTPGGVSDSAGTYDATAANGPTTQIASSALPGDPGTCRYGQFDRTNDYLLIPGFPNLTSSFTIAAWVRVNDLNGDQRVFADDYNNTGGYAVSVGDTGNPGIIRFFSRSLTPVSLDTPALYDTNTWHHVAVVHRLVTRQRLIYFDGAVVAVDAPSGYGGTVGVDVGNASIGGEIDGSAEGVPQWRLGGSIDEVRVYGRALGASEIASVMASRHPCSAGPNHFKVSHDGSAIQCLGEPVTVTARSAADAVLTSYTGSITLDTQTGRGNWVLVSGSGPFSDSIANDGLATYTFSALDSGSATFALTYEGPTPINVDAYATASPTTRDDDSEGLLSVAPSGFTVTASALSNPPPNPITDPIPTETAGATFALHLTAYGQTPDDPVCGVIESYSGTKTLQWWSTWQNPDTGFVTPAINGSSIGASSSTPASLAIVFSNGQASVSAKYKDVGQIAIAMRDAAMSPAVSGWTNSFVVKPADFAITAVTTPSLGVNPGSSAPSGPVFVASGDPFRAVVEVRDAEGSRTPNYGRESAPEGVRLRAELVAPAGGRNGTADDGAIGNGTAFSAVAPSGTFSGSTFYWDEVGAVRLRASVGDGSYLGAGDVLGAPSAPVGRFRAHHFDVSYNSPRLRTACAPGSFTYVGQSFDYAPGESPLLTATARNAQGTTTQNYAGAWQRMTAATLTGLAYGAAIGSISPSSPAPPTVADAGPGDVSIAFSNGPALSLTRGSPVAPFAADVSLSLNVVDADGVVYPGNPARFGTASPGLGVAFTAGKGMRYGRVALSNANGSELVPLAVPLSAEYWNGTVFTANTADSCSLLPIGELGLTPSPIGLASTPTIANSPLAAGSAGLTLSPPGAGNTGYFGLTYDLSTATGAGLEFLRYDWNGDGTYTEDPTGRATFGIFAGDGKLIYVRERY